MGVILLNKLTWNRNMILNRAKDYYENDKERLREQARDKFIWRRKKIYKKENMEEADTEICLKKKKQRLKYRNMSEEKKRLKEYQINYCKAKKSQYNNE